MSTVDRKWKQVSMKKCATYEPDLTLNKKREEWHMV